MAATQYTTHETLGRRRRIGGLRLLAAALIAAVLVGGYQEHWSWTGISGKTATLWDWLHLLLLPLAIPTLLLPAALAITAGEPADEEQAPAR